MGFGDRPVSQAHERPVPYYLKDDDRPRGIARYGCPMPQKELTLEVEKNQDATAKLKQCNELIGELDTMKAVAKMLDPLPGGAVRRILSWLADRYGFALVNVDEVAPPLGLNRDTEPMPPSERNPVQVAPWTPPSRLVNGGLVWSGE